MLKLLEKEIYLEESPIIMQLALNCQADLDQFECATGEWKIENDALVGRNRDNSGGICYSRQSFPGDILLDFYGTMLAPCSNDLNFVFKTEGWDYRLGDAGRGFIGGLNGWYQKRAGIEKYPECTTRSLVEFNGVAEKEYHIQTGYIQDTAFLFVDDRLIVEMRDPAPEEFEELGRVGLGTYCSQIKFRNLTVYRPEWKEVSQTYTAQF